MQASLVHSSFEVRLGRWSLTRFSGLRTILHGSCFYHFGNWFHSLSHPSFFVEDGMCLQLSFLSLLPASRTFETHGLFAHSTVPVPFSPNWQFLVITFSCWGLLRWTKTAPTYFLEINPSLPSAEAKERQCPLTSQRAVERTCKSHP